MRRPVVTLIVVAALAACSPAPEPAVTTVGTSALSGEAEEPDTGSGTSSTTTTEAATTTPAPPPTTSTLPALVGLAYEPVADGLPFPTWLTPGPGDGSSWLATKDGRLWRLGEEGLDAEPILDIRDRVRNQGEQGLLGLALHPTDRQRIFVHYTASDGDTVLSEFAATGGRVQVDSEREVLRLDQPAANHNGGMIQFGPDGLLYLGLGDGGGGGDQYRNGQNADSLLGGIVRIDVDGGDPYAVPDDNPFAEGGGAAELWAFGLRNPWRFWIDPAGPDLYLADVGQSLFEEVNVVALRPVGYNFGWPTTEGLHCFAPRQGCSTAGLTLPVVEISHGDGSACSVTGGVVYRGEAIPELDGHYLYSDWCGGWLRSFRWTGTGVVDERDWTDQVGIPGNVASFGVGHDGEVYVLTTDSILRLSPIR